MVAVIIGVAGDILLRETPWGLNVFVFNAVFAGGMFTLLRRHAPQYLTAQTISLFGALLFFASMFAWRDSIELRTADFFAILAVLSALFLSRMHVMPRVSGVIHYIVGFIWASFSAMVAPLLLIFNDLEWSDIPRDGWRKHLFSVMRGLAVAIPIILIFGALFVAADAAYEGLVERVFKNIVPEVVITHVILFGIFSWLSAGYLRGALLQEETGPIASVVPDGADPVRQDPAASRMDRVRDETGEQPVTLPGDRTVVEHLNISDPHIDTTESSSEYESKKEVKQPWSWATIDNGILPVGFTLGSVEVGVILGLMNLLFLSFVIVQVPYLFGGMELVQNTPDFNLAEYARRGFGELVAVSALVLPILLATHWLLKKDDSIAYKLYRVFAGVQIALLFVIMASAVQRMFLLTGNLGYGLTTIRLYPMIFMVWLAIVFVWFAVTVLRGTRRHFAWGALWFAFLTLGATHFLNPDAYIVTTNIALATQGRDFDAIYNARLSDDALPALVESFDVLDERDQQAVATRLAERYCDGLEENDLRSWNYSRSHAAKVLASIPHLPAAIGDCDSNELLNGPYRYGFFSSEL